MKAAICTAYGPPEVLQIANLPDPKPGTHEVLVRIKATAVTASDCIVRSFDMPRWQPMGMAMGLALGFRKPRNPILGMVYAGVVEALGENVTEYKTGDRVVGWTVSSGLSLNFGTYAEYKAVAAKGIIASIPSSLNFEQAAALPYGGLIALSYLQKLGIGQDKMILIYGASGAIGTMAVQLAVHYGAEVTGVCSTANLELVRSLGARKMLDYKKDDPSIMESRFDLMLDAVGKRKSSSFKEACRKKIVPGGKYLSVDDGSPNMNRENLRILCELAGSEAIRPVIDRTYPLEEIVEAHRYVDSGHKKGNVIITV